MTIITDPPVWVRGTARFCGPNRFGLVSEDGNTGENQKHVSQGELKGQVRYWGYIFLSDAAKFCKKYQ